MRFPLTIALAIATALPIPASAQDPVLPEALASMLEEDRALCDDGAFSAAPGTMTEVDLDGDGVKDWLYDRGAIRCDSDLTLYCGTMGCGITTMIGGVTGELLLHAWRVVAEDGQTLLVAPSDNGEARFRWDAAAGAWTLLPEE
ncbi:hypothetical protein [Frigidibacter sp. SD6-1]|uniref:hypothetical protein n=1 Tax=Frigidibacter sp. SD6-1 TaxID=3032581 RepID=UPI0024E001C8|nr:hypothetical protein [Frigidibacter sp. SD6-1]